MDHENRSHKRTPDPETQKRDAELIQACRSGNSAAWSQLLETFERLVFSVPLQHGLNRQEAEDIVQTTFMLLYQNLDTLWDNSNLASWLYAVALRRTWRVLKQTGRKIALDVEIDWPELAENMTGADGEDLEKWELTAWLDQGLAKLGPNCRELLMTLYFGEQSPPRYTDVSAKLGIPIGSIGPSRARCLEKLRQILQNI